MTARHSSPPRGPDVGVRRYHPGHCQMTPDGCPRPSSRPRSARTCRALRRGPDGLALTLAPTMRVAPGLTETDQGRSIVSGPVIMGGAFRAFAAARSRRNWLATWPVMSA